MDRRVSEAWKAAAKELGIEVEAPFRLSLKSGDSFEVEALVRHFGGSAGTLVTTTEQMEVLALVQAGPYCGSAVNPLHYRRFDRSRFIRTLADWGWYGEGEPPVWLGLNPAPRISPRWA
jgi:hypothetical protein